MPSVYAEPTIQELLDAFGNGVRVNADRHVDVREGALYQHWSGVAAILWRRNAQRTTDIWRANYLDSAEGNELTGLLSGRYSFDRIPDAYGLGTVTLTRASGAAGGGTIWAGTRITVFGSAETPTEARVYVVTTDTPIVGAALTSSPPVRADVPGPGTAINITSGARVEDPLWDSTWTVTALTCVDGTTFEPAADARARWRDVQRASRPGYEEAIILACEAAGADVAYLFPSDYAGEENDGGLNMAYVGLANYTTTAALIRNVTVALESYRVLGDNLQIRGLGRANVNLEINVYLWEGPLRTNLADVTKRIKGAMVGYFNQVLNFGYQRDAMAGAILKAAPEVQFATFVAPVADADIVQFVNGRWAFPDTLDLFYIDASAIVLNFLPPL